MDKATENIFWHHINLQDLSHKLSVNFKQGLMQEEVKTRQLRFGPNSITPQKRINELMRFLFQFNQPLVYILLVASAITLYLGETVDSLVIFGVVFINAIVGYIQEAKAERAIESLSNMVSTEATVTRNSRKERVPSKDLVPGDIITLQSGDRVPADLRLFHVHNLQIDESPLTGESVPVEKRSEVLKIETPLADRKNMAFAGTLVTYGQAEGVVLQSNVICCVSDFVIEEIYFKFLQFYGKSAFNSYLSTQTTGRRYRDWKEYCECNPRVLGPAYNALNVFNQFLENNNIFVLDYVRHASGEDFLYKEANNIIQKWGLISNDAFIIAHSLHCGYTNFITTDNKWDKVNGITICKW